MAYLKAFGKYLPGRVVENQEIGGMVETEAEWIRNVSGIEQRRFAGAEETVADMGHSAARDCLERADVSPAEVGLILTSSGSTERSFPGPAATIAAKLGLDATPAIDLPIASAGSVFALSLASRLTAVYRNILVVASEKMSTVVLRQPLDRGVAPLFGDGAGACLVSESEGKARVLDSAIHSDGAFSEDLRLAFDRPLEMNGRSVILQASRKIPRAIQEVLESCGRTAAEIDTFLMHQANQNLINRVAQAVGVPEAKFFSNIARCGNTSSASMLIAAAEWDAFRAGASVVFAGFGAGFHWGAMLVEGV
ncbi:MAG TPA: ketoacyl-ACP synthase III [Solibacterales bacterium]|nr:ketoacyl-ACP synthase III [Bryobacterales bacterium]